jgi:hypothetical protein
VVEHSRQVRESGLVQHQQCAEARAVEKQEAAFQRSRRRERRVDLTFMKLAWHRQLGAGVLATVRSALAIEPGLKQSLWTEYAITVMQKAHIDAENARARIEAEAALLESLDHRNVIWASWRFSRTRSASSWSWSWRAAATCIRCSCA